MRELLDLRNEKQAHFRMLADNISAADKGETHGFGHDDDWEDKDEEDGFAAVAVKSLKCLGVKCATTCVCNAICSLSQATHVLYESNSALLSKSVLPKILARASILRTNNTVFPQHALVVLDTFQLSQAHESHERAVSWETSPRAWLSKVRAIEIYNGLIPVPDFSVVPIDGLTEDDMSELLTLRKEKELRLSSVPSTNILHQQSSIHLIPAGTVLVVSPLGPAVHSPAHNDSVAYVRTGHCLIQPSVTLTLHSQNPTIYVILKKQRTQDQVVGGVLDSGAQRGATGRKSEILKHTGTSLLMQTAVGPAKHMTGILMGAETRDSHGKPFVLVVSDVSVYDPAMSDSLNPMGRLVEAGFTVNHRIPSQAKKDGFSLKQFPLYGGTIARQQL